MPKQYRLRYLPLFEKDLEEAVMYIAFELQNPNAAERLIDQVEKAIFKRLDNPEAFESYLSRRERKYPYYRIYVKNYVVYYVVINDVMEVRRLLYKRRDVNEIL